MNDVLYPGGFKDNLFPTYDRAGAELDTTLALKLYKCPGDDGPPRGAHCPDWVNHPERSSYNHFGNSYAANLFMIWAPGGTLGPEFTENEMGSNSPYMRPTSRIPTPSRTLYYEENIGRWAWACWRDPCDFIPGIDPGPTKTVRGWHDRDWTFNRAFVDAHAESHKVYVEGTEDLNGYARHYRSEQLFEDPDRQQGWHCVIVRGDGWQKDTLPAELITTGLLFPGPGRASYEDCVETEPLP